MYSSKPNNGWGVFAYLVKKQLVSRTYLGRGEAPETLYLNDEMSVIEGRKGVNPMLISLDL